MIDFFQEHWLLTILGTIVLGAIGSGLWDVALKPLGRKMGSVLFTLLTFGAKRARDRIYREAAKGHHEWPAVYVLVMLICFAVGAPLGGSVAFVTIGDVKEQFVTECGSESDSTDQPSCLRARLIENYGLYFTVFIVFASVFLIYQILKIGMINIIVTNFEQCLRALGPALTTAQRLRLEQDFALMESKEAHEVILKELFQIAETAHVQLPNP